MKHCPFSPENAATLYCSYGKDPVHWSASAHFQSHLIQGSGFRKTNHENQDKDLPMSVLVTPVVLQNLRCPLNQQGRILINGTIVTSVDIS